jgi:transposase
MKPISKQLHSSIISLLDAGLSSCQIAAQLGVGHSTVDRVRAATRPDLQKHQAGRPAKLTATNKHRLVHMIITGKADTAAQLTRELYNSAGMELSTKTTRRALREAGMKAVTKKKKPRLLPRHISQCLDFALRH